MGIYRDIFEKRYKISNKEIFDLKNFSPISPNYSPIYPFASWKNNFTPDWWEKYTKIKHDRFRNKEQATLKSTIDALAGLFALFLTHPETLDVLIDRDVIISGGHPKAYTKEILSHPEPITEMVNRIYSKTSLFGYVFEIHGYPNDDESKIKVLSPSYLGYG